MNHLALTPQRLADKNHFREIRNSASISAFRVPDNNSPTSQNPAERIIPVNYDNFFPIQISVQAISFHSMFLIAQISTSRQFKL